MLQFKTTQKKMYRPPVLADSRRELPRPESFQILEHSIISKVPDRNNDNNINLNLISNFNQIKQLLRDRKNLLKAKHESMVIRNRQKIMSITHARDQDLRNEAKMLNDRSILNLIDHAQSLNKSKSLMLQIADIKNMSAYDANARNYGKQFWDKHKQFERQKKKKAQKYHSHSRQLKQLNQQQRNIFNQIENSQNQIVYHLTKGRNDPDHVSRAEILSDLIEKKKNVLRQIKGQKTKIKNTIQKIIEDILEFNNAHEKIYEGRIKQIDQIFVGTENVTEFDGLLGALEKIIANRNVGQRVDAIESGENLVEYYNQYDRMSQHIDKMKEEEEQIFGNINDEMRENIKAAIIQKSFFSGISLKADPNELFRKLKDYRKLLIDFSEERPRLRTQINKMNQMNNALYPIKRDYETQDVRREDLKRELKRLFSLNSDLQAKQKEQRNSVFNLQQLHHKRTVIEADINDLAEKVNLGEYKTKMRELQEVNKKIKQKNDAALQQAISRMSAELQDSFNRLYQNYEDLINEVQIREEQPSLGVFLSKLQKRLSLI